MDRYDITFLKAQFEQIMALLEQILKALEEKK